MGSEMCIRDSILGVAFECGLERVVIPFFPYGMPVEYELMRSINTVSQSERKTIGILDTDLFIVGGNIRTREGNLPIPTLKIVRELSKQYNLEIARDTRQENLWLESEEGEPEKRRYDLLLVAQPSTLSPVEMTNLIAAIQSGQPTVIFEDPFPNPENFRHLQGRGTLWPRMMNRGGAGTGDIRKLWDALDLDIDTVTRDQQSSPYLVWQLASENPYTRDAVLNLPERLVVQELRDDIDPLYSKSHPATRGIVELCFQYSGYLSEKPNSSLEFDYLVKTGKAGRLPQLEFWAAIAQLGMFNPQTESALQTRRGNADREFPLAAHIAGINSAKAVSEKLPLARSNTNVIYVCDVDVLADYFVDIRNNPIQRGTSYRFQNMAFVLNLVDAMVGEETYLDLRSRKIRHMTLQVVEQTTEEAMQDVYEATQDLEIERIQAEAQIQANINEEVGPLQSDIKKLETKRSNGDPIDINELNAKQQLFENIQLQQKQRMAQKQEELGNSHREQLRSIQLDAENKIQEIQKKFKLYAVFIPPIPPLLVGLIVFTRRRLREREGISKARRLK